MVQQLPSRYLDHENLVNELKTLEDFNPQERLDHARKRRKDQLASYSLRKSNDPENTQLTQASHDKNIHFQPNITFIEASARNDADEVEKLITVDNLCPDLQKEDGLSALHQAVIEDCADVVLVLVQNGADLNIKDADLWTPLHAAVACGNYDLAKFLIENGASLIEINTDGNMPIDLVEDNEDIEMLLDNSMVDLGFTEETLEDIRSVIPNQMLEDLRVCRDNNEDLDVKGAHGETACHIACANGYLEVLDFLLDNGAKFDIGDEDDWQPIHAAACWGHDRIIEVLVGAGADLEARTKDGETPYDLTEDEDMQEMLIELKETGSKLTPKVKRSQSNSSRTLSVRRSSIVEKRQTSINDAKHEASLRATPIDINDKTEDDQDNSDSESNNITNGNTSDSEKDNMTNSEDAEEKESNQESSPIEQKEQLKEDNEALSDSILDSTTDNCVVTINSVEEKVECEINTEHEKTEIVQETNNITNVNANHNTTEHSRDENKVEIEIAPQAVQSHNTAAKKENNHKFNDSNDSTVKKKCCVIL